MKNKAVIAGFVALLTVVSALAVIPAMPAAAASEDVLYVAMQADVPDFNNYNIGSNSIWKANVIQYCFEALSTTDYDLKSVPLLAEPWTFYESELKVEVPLKHGVLFHDGTEMTSEDVVFSYLMARDGTTYADRIIQAFDIDDNGVVSETELNTSVKTNGTYAVTMVMARPYGQFFSSALAVPIVPKDIWEHHVDAQSRVDVRWGTDTDALIGTGAYFYDSGVANSYRIIKKFEQYWGKDYNGPGQHWLTPAGFPTYPVVLDKVHYKIYTSIDTAILALQAGDVNYIAWAVTPGRVPALQSDPNIELEYMSDSGYFYLAFNMKKEPMNNLTFRKAMSHLIDKEQIVDTYMSGFGQPGSAAVPPFFGEWHNPAVTKYAFDVAIAESLLDEAGYVDVNSDGWRELPDGRLMEKITLLCPPADYDPIRIRAGQMLATNMRAAGINVEAKPIDFNTLVAKLTAFDYQMLELGWSFTGYTECVSLLFDIYSPYAVSNSWAFWSDANPSPLYSTLGGVSTLADDATKAMADEFVALEDDARASFDVAVQIDKVKQGQQIIADAVPCNILYYRVNVEAHDKVWTNWTIFDGRLLNAFSWTVLDYSGTGGATGGKAVATLDAGLTTPEKIQCDETVTATVKAINNKGEPVSGATVDVTAGSAATVSPATGTTNANGVFQFSVTGASVGISTVRANVTSASLTANDSANVRVSSLGGIGVVLTPEKTVLAAGESMDVVATVTDVNGDPVAGATVTMDPGLLGFGTVAPSTAVTGAGGTVTIVYTAPADIIPNQHLLAQLAASVAHPKYTLSNFAANGILVYNTAAPDWHMVSIDTVSTTALSAASPTASITVKATDAAGTAVVGEVLGITYSNDSMLVSPVTEVTTIAGGLATFDVTYDDIGFDAAQRVTIGNRVVSNAIMDTVTLTYADTGALTGMYGGYIDYATPKFVDALGSIDVDIYVFDSQGSPAADGTSASVVVSATAYGQLTDWSGSEWNSLEDGVGVKIVTAGDEQNLVTAGSFSAPLFIDEWVYDPVGDVYVPLDISGVTLTGGMYSMTINGVDLANLDLVMDLFLVPDATSDFDWDTWNHEIDGQTVISSEYGYGRAMEITSVMFDIENPVLAAKASEFDGTNVTVVAYDKNNDPLSGAGVVIYQASTSGGSISDSDYGVVNSTAKVPTTQTTGANGTAMFRVVGAAWGTTAYDQVSRATTPTMFVRATLAGTLRVVSQTQLVIEPLRESVFVKPDPVLDVKMIGDAVYVTVTVTDKLGAVYADLPVSIVTDTGVAMTPTVLTDGDGKATFAIDTSGVADAAGALIAATVSTGGTPEGATARVSVALQNLAPEIEVTAPVADGELEGPDASIMGAIYDANGIAKATLVIDDGDPIDLIVTAGSLAIAVSELIEGLDNGEHTLTVFANDTLGVSSETVVTFTVVSAADGGDATLAWIVAAVGWIVAALVLVFLLLKMRKPAGAAPEAPVEEKKE